MANEILENEEFQTQETEQSDSIDSKTILTGENKDNTEQTGTIFGNNQESAIQANDKKDKPWDLKPAYSVSEEDLKAYEAHCRSIGMTQEQAQKSLEYAAANLERQQTAFLNQRKEWVSEIRADREFGGGRYAQSVVEARRALATFDPDGTVRAMLEETGYGDNPAIIRICARIGRAMAEDTFSLGKVGTTKKPLEERMYPNM